MTNQLIKVFRDTASLAEDAARRVAEACEAAKERFRLVLAGGSTPRTLYQLLAGEPYRSKIEWAKVEIYFGDERCVPAAHADSNYRMAKEALLSRVPIPPDQIHRMRGEIEPQAAATEYGRMLKEHFGDDGGPDLTLLGMGDDGHTASLFPETTALVESKHRCVANYVEKHKAWRITLTAPFFNRSAAVMILVTGASKARRLHEVLDGPPQPMHLPIQLIQPRGQLIWLLDTAAAGMI